MNYLTPREREVLRYVGSGYASKNIADHLGVSKKCIDRHRQHICAKLNTPSTALLVLRAVELGVVTPAVHPLVPVRNGGVLRYLVT